MFLSLFVRLSVCLLVTLQKKTSKWICMKFSGKVGNEPVNKPEEDRNYRAKI